MNKFISKGINWYCRTRLVTENGALYAHGLRERVEILRDHWGIPHIYANNPHDLFFGQGFAHAQDRLWQMEFQRRLITGRLAEVLGKAALPVDQWMRVLGLHRTASRELDLLAVEERQILESYALGVNEYIRRGSLPVEFSILHLRSEPWQPVDSLYLSKMMAWNLSANWESELLRGRLIDLVGEGLAAELELNASEAWPIVLNIPSQAEVLRRIHAPVKAFLGPGQGTGLGSNNWVISGSRTSSGYPLLANDMHLPMSAPSIWYENHLCGGGFHVTGVSLPGAPMVIAGHNGQVAWGFTAGFGDVQDLYEERLRMTDDGGIQYEYRSEWLPARIHQETINVRLSKPFIQDVIVTRHGPIINNLLPDSLASPPLAMRFMALDPDPGVMNALRKMNQASNYIEFRQAMETWTAPVLNVVYADAENICYSFIGKIPVRANGDGKTPVPGWNGEHEWEGCIDYYDLPYIMNPPQGYIATANNRTAPDNYPHLLGSDYINGDRAQRIIELIQENDIVDIEWMRRMQYDQVSPSARSFAQYVAGLPDEDPDDISYIQIMRDWNGSLDANSPAAALYEIMVRKMVEALLKNRLGVLTRFVSGKSVNPLGSHQWGDHVQEWLLKTMANQDSHWFRSGPIKDRNGVLRQVLKESVAELTLHFGPDLAGWSWGRLHQVTFGHLLGMQSPLNEVFNRGPYPIGGDGNTIWASFSHNSDIAHETIVGPPFRFIADLSDLDHCYGQLTPGQSGQPGSLHYDDQIEDWFNGVYHPMLFRREEVEAEIENRLVLFPSPDG